MCICCWGPLLPAWKADTPKWPFFDVPRPGRRQGALVFVSEKGGCFWVNCNDLTRPHPKWWSMWGIAPQPPYFRLVNYYISLRCLHGCCFETCVDVTQLVPERVRMPLYRGFCTLWGGVGARQFFNMFFLGGPHMNHEFIPRKMWKQPQLVWMGNSDTS